MRHALFLAAAAILLGGTTFSQIVDGGTYYFPDGTSCTVDVTDTNGAGTPGVDVTVTDDTGFTTALDGSAGVGSTEDNPNAKSFEEGTTNGNPGNTYRGSKNRIQKKNAAGKYVNGRRGRKKNGLDRPPRIEALTVGPGNSGTSLPNGPTPP